ncbi:MULTISPECIES: Bax inhibitor-1/YccA family protein [unclassified Granulicatella]|uniref:Bax inhibitor-1/YccA family protein n=1 Tax=unclassified Granulicatella TaxID=2630493 RepID=UPI001073A750|nr:MULTISPECIES: Bax inhibitor-1/YccA family protein [unclassified Granulicatella]MBF0779711.1 Bax inhibitor-1/YccA family protein [Granulicatella sp. 19428wC4_WM01]TFU96232.1 Bax inhibitor-1/YccA family protein [Granulicatella sp. WM01]
MNNTVYSVEQQRGINRFIAKSFSWMIGGLLISALSAYILLNTRELLYMIVSNRLAYFGLIIAQLVLAYGLRIDPAKLENTGSYMFKFILYSMLTGVTFSVVALVYTSQSIIQAFVSTAALFAILCLYGYSTSKDLTKLGHFLFPVLIGVIVVSVLNILFFRSSGMGLVLSILTMIIFIGLTMYDMQKIKSIYLYFEGVPSVHTSLSIGCALELYLDFINLFLSVLRIFGRTRD